LVTDVHVEDGISFDVFGVRFALFLLIGFVDVLEEVGHRKRKEKKNRQRRKFDGAWLFVLKKCWLD